MKTKLSLALFSWSAVFFSGCAAFQAGSEFGAGREAYLAGNNDAALSYFQSAAQTDPNYSYYGYAFRQGIWSYVGRTEYATGKLPQARQSLEHALSLNKDEDVARLYLGLTLVREGDRQRGLTEIEGGMKGIYTRANMSLSTSGSRSGDFGTRKGKSARRFKINSRRFRGEKLIGRNFSPIASGSAREWSKRSTGRAATKESFLGSQRTPESRL